MTVDMLATAFIWPEEMLLGRTHIGDDRPTDAPAEPETTADPAAPAAEPLPFWGALVRRFRAEPGADAH